MRPENLPTASQQSVRASRLTADIALAADTLVKHLSGEGFKARAHICRALDPLTVPGMVNLLDNLTAYVACTFKHDANRLVAIAMLRHMRTAGRMR